MTKIDCYNINTLGLRVLGRKLITELGKETFQTEPLAKVLAATANKPLSTEDQLYLNYLYNGITVDGKGKHGVSRNKEVRKLVHGIASGNKLPFKLEIFSFDTDKPEWPDNPESAVNRFKKEETSKPAASKATSRQPGEWSSGTHRSVVTTGGEKKAELFMLQARLIALEKLVMEMHDQLQEQKLVKEIHPF